MSRKWSKQSQVKIYALLYPSTQRDTGLTLDLQVPFYCLLLPKEPGRTFARRGAVVVGE